MPRPTVRLGRIILIAPLALAIGACSSSAGWTAAPVPATAIASAPPTVAPSPAPAALAALASTAALAPCAASSAATATRTVPIYVSLTVLSDTMTGKAGWPVFLHSDFTLPAHSFVTITVTNFDNATPLAKGTEGLEKASGIVGDTFEVTPINAWDPNGSAGPTTTLSALDPAHISHTFTDDALGFNVPIAPDARTTFTIKTGNPGTCAWHCFVPCGTGANGFGGPMAASTGYMEGKLSVV